MKKLLEKSVDAYIADRKFRLRDPQYATLQEHQSKTVDRKRTSKARKYFSADQFHFDATGILNCPAGKSMKSNCPNWKNRTGYTGHAFRGFEQHCGPCPLRLKCLRNLQSKVRQVVKSNKGMRQGSVCSTKRMIERFDSQRGRSYYSRRMGTVEPVFANIVITLGMNHFTLRGKTKADTQWKLYCMVHNIGKLTRYGKTR